jgi:hypothetical protein
MRLIVGAEPARQRNLDKSGEASVKCLDHCTQCEKRVGGGGGRRVWAPALARAPRLSITPREELGEAQKPVRRDPVTTTGKRRSKL